MITESHLIQRENNKKTMMKTFNFEQLLKKTGQFRDGEKTNLIEHIWEYGGQGSD